ncbi:MAG: phosphatase [Phycisphaerae bacterium]|nr:phosphatase [Phycisphaerae bacterium]
MTGLNRRDFVSRLAATGAGFAGLGRAAEAGLLGTPPADAYGRLRSDPDGLLDLPEGFSYQLISRWGEEMDDGLLVPGLHDGMAAFDGGHGRVVLVRNHEVGIDSDPSLGAFGPKLERLPRVDPAMIYDVGRAGAPCLGGTTTVVYDPKTRKVVRHFLSLAGTGRNCAGGATPWNTWITCEEWTQRANETCAADHGWCFEIPASGRQHLAAPRPLRALGRFNHEAVAVAPDGRCVYLTEDRNDGIFYRFVPREPGRLAAGGRLQALVIDQQPSADTRNWIDPATELPSLKQGDRMSVRWIDLDDPESAGDDLRFRGFEAGAARFARGEGIWTGRDAVHFACTTGGVARLGQIFTYRPSPHEGLELEKDAPGSLELFVESEAGGIIENADNLTVAPWGDLFINEDGIGTDGIVRVRPDGSLERFAMVRASDSETAGICFSPDGDTMFVNIQHQGLTVVIRGPWMKKA